MGLVHQLQWEETSQKEYIFEMRDHHDEDNRETIFGHVCAVTFSEITKLSLHLVLTPAGHVR